MWPTSEMKARLNEALCQLLGKEFNANLFAKLTLIRCLH